MSRFAIFAGLMAVSVAAQAEFAAPGFKYIGCVEAEPAVFNAKADLPAPFSVQQCQDACHAKGKYAAMDGSCNCYDSSSKAEPSYNILDESVCSLPCIGGNRTAGVCGGPQCEVTGKKRYSLYKQEVEHHDGDDYDKEDKQELKYHDGTDYEKVNKQEMENYDGDDCEEEYKQEMEHYDGDDCEEEDKKEMDHHDCDHCEKEGKQEMKHHDGNDFEKEDTQELKYHDGTGCEKENKQDMEHHDGNDCEKENKKEMEYHDGYGDGWEKEDKTKETGIQTNAQERVAISLPHQPIPLNLRVLRSAALHALLRAAQLVPLVDASQFVLQAAPTLQHAMASTARSASLHL
ncbi:hypothetical protein TASIC1_0015003200 [Trichoderma asperellum]|uniref:WSC domain-containing protein n=1 Tax=Trichoderma asperellum TaxID=101201 RepID=A0A6V8RB79_TRIAP|nr:hypothetical protein TASIC1_0015003200 [Trichoderma asperellum]